MNWWQRLNLILLASIFTISLLLMLIYPQSLLTAAERGLSIWWDVLFPSLLPFFIISEMLLGFGIVHFIGTLLDPIMRPLFRVPGVGGFVMAMGYASGYPVGAKLTTRLRSQGLITREEGERLVAFTTTSDPIFLIGAVSVGFFGHASLALTLIAAHYGAGLLLGILMRFYAPHAAPTPLQKEHTQPKRAAMRHIFMHAFSAMHHARINDGRSIGTMLRQAVESSLKLMIVVGGLVVFFSVVMELLTASSVMLIWDSFLSAALSMIGLPNTLAQAFSSGLFEVTLGAKSAGAATQAGTHLQLVAAAWVLSWAGLSVHAQIASILNQTDLRYTPFVISRLIHSFLAAIAAYWLYPWLKSDTANSPTWTPATLMQEWNGWSDTIPVISWGMAVFIGITSIMVVLGVFIHLLRSNR
ncbi:sporulation integral membrane protein YlbJ [Paenibacillus marinisediminis]